MTAQELHEMVKGWPKEAQPDGLYYRGKTGCVPMPKWCIKDGRVPVELAVALFESSGLHWLIADGDPGSYSINKVAFGDGPECFRLMYYHDGTGYELKHDYIAPTLFDAIHAAISAASSPPKAQ